MGWGFGAGENLARRYLGTGVRVLTTLHCDEETFDLMAAAEAEDDPRTSPPHT